MEAEGSEGAFRRAKYFNSLDGLRAISIVAVILCHSRLRASALLEQGAMGVELFFAISGFLITTLLLREKSRTGTISLRGFYVRRTLRIFPAYYATIALYLLVVTLFERHTAAGVGFYDNLPKFLTYTSNWWTDPRQITNERRIFYFAWSLATEEQFYLVWPWFVAFAPRRWIPILAMCGMLAAHLGAEWAVGAGLLPKSPLPVRILLSISSPICLGCLAAYVLHDPRGFQAASLMAGRRWSAPLGTAALLVQLNVGAPDLAIDISMVYLVVACVIRQDHPLRALLENRAVRYVGAISYGMYLFHMLAMNAGRRLAPVATANSVFVRFVLAVGISILFASISHRYFERRCLALKDRLPTPAPSRAGDCAAPLT